jgi:hypothetical protein
MLYFKKLTRKDSIMHDAINYFVTGVYFIPWTFMICLIMKKIWVRAFTWPSRLEGYQTPAETQKNKMG